MIEYYSTSLYLPPRQTAVLFLLHLFWHICAFFVPHANHMYYYCLQLHDDAFNLIQIITPCLINITIIQFLCVCMVHHWFVLYCVCVFICVWMCLPNAATPQIIKVGRGPDWQYEMFIDGGDRKLSGTVTLDKYC